MQYLIDGYNFLFRLGEGKKKSLEQAREALIAALNEKLHVFRAPVSIVFDSSEQIRDFAQSAKLPNLDVLYAPKGLTADEYMIELVEQAKNPKNTTIVSSDGGLARQCQHLGAKTLSIDEFLHLLQKRNGKKPSVKPIYKETSHETERLLKIFEKKLQGDGEVS